MGFFTIESYKSMEIPIPNDEDVLLVPRTLFWLNQRKGGWTDTICVLTNKGIHFRLRKDKISTDDFYDMPLGKHNMLKNTFLAYDRIKRYQRGTGLWSTTYLIEMVDGYTFRFGFHKHMAEVTDILNHMVHAGSPRDLRPYDYASHDPESVPHRNVAAGR